MTAAGASFWLPPEGATGAAKVDWLFNFITWLSIFFFVLVTVLLVVFVWKYRSRPGHQVQESPDHNLALEVLWSVIPLFLVIWIFWQGFKGFLDDVTPPLNAYEVQVSGQQWKWSFTYPNGYTDSNLHVPADTPIRVVLTSVDVIHSFYVPDFRVKRDAVPGRIHTAWFLAPKPGEHDLFCAEYCGKIHSGMIAKVVVHDPAEFDKWLETASNFLATLPPERLWEGGQKIYQMRGCVQCHSVDGTRGTGPTLKGIWDHVQPLADGSSVKVDEAYLRESILLPTAKVAQGYEPVMPSFQGRLKDQEVAAIVAYIKTLEK